MAQLKDLLVTGAARILGKLYASEFVGKLTGNADSATKATKDSANQQINTTYIKGLSVSGRTITYTKGDNTTGTITTQDTNTTYSDATTSAHGLMTAADKVKLNGIATNANNYVHPTHTAKASGLYKVTVDGTGHVSAVTAVTKADITALGIPGQDTNTWRGIQNNLTSTSTDQSLSAAQGKILNDRVGAKLPLSGGAMTGDISYKGTKATFPMIKFIDNTVDTNGNGIAIGGGGLTIIGGGESSDAVRGSLTGSSEQLILANDGAIDIYTNCQNGISKATHNTIDNNGLYSGTSAKANKLSTARNVSGGTDITMSFNYDGSANSGASIGYYNCSANKQNTNNYPFHRFAKLDTITGAYVDKTTTFLITQDYNGGGFGIVRVSLRAENTGSVSHGEIKWLVRSGLAADSVQMGLYNVFGSTYADLFFKSSGTYAGTIFRAIANGARGSVSRTWVLVNSSEVSNTTTSDKKTSSEVYTSVAAAATALHSKAYSTTVSGVDAGAVSWAGSANRVADANNSNSISLAYSKSGMKYNDYTWLAGWNGYELRAVDKSQFTPKSTKVTTTITASKWTGSGPYTNTITVSGVTASNNVEVLIPGSATNAQVEAWMSAGIANGTQTTNSITLKAYGDKPSIDIPIECIIRKDI